MILAKLVIPPSGESESLKKHSGYGVRNSAVPLESNETRPIGAQIV